MFGFQDYQIHGNFETFMKRHTQILKKKKKSLKNQYMLENPPRV